MQINFKGHGLDVTPALKAFTQDKLQKLEHHFEHIKTFNIVFRVEKLRQIAEATLTINKAEIHASAESEDMYGSIHTLVDRLDRQLNEHKQKKLDYRDHRGHIEEQ